MEQRNKLDEGIVTGDHGYNASNIASGESSGNIVNSGAETYKQGSTSRKTRLKRKKKSEIIDTLKTAIKGE